MSKKKFLIGGLVAAIIAAIVTFIVQGSANATEGDEPCVPSDAWTETIEHPAVTHVVHHDAVTHDVTVVDSEAVDQWWHWNGGPSGPSGPPPSEGWNTDNGNHNGFPDDVNVIIQRDKSNSGRSDWFFHEFAAEVTHTETVVDQEAYDETVVDEEAWTETIEHDAVVCEEDPEDPTDPPTIVVHVPCGVFLRPIADGHHIYIWEKNCPNLVKHPPKKPVVHKTPALKVGVPLVINAGL